MFNSFLLTEQEASKILRVSQSTLRHWRSDRKMELRWLKIGGKIFYDPRRIEEFIERSECKKE